MQPVAMPDLGNDVMLGKSVLKNAQFRLNLTSKQLEASRETAAKATDQMIEATKALGEINGEIAKLDLQKINVSLLRIAYFED